MAEDYKHNQRVLESARSLVEELEAGNGERVDELLEELSSMRESNLFTEMGKLTRELHDSLRNFELDSRIAEMAEEEIPNARERLNHVITVTEQAANKTMDAVEVSIPLAEKIRKTSDELFEKWQRFRNRDLSVEEFRELSKELDRFLSDVSTDSKSLNSSLSEVLLAQDFQDITGQIICQVISLVQGVEEGLVDLIRISTPGRGKLASVEVDMQLDDKKGEADITAEGPQIPSRKSDNYVQGQDDVDDLLSSLGF